MQNALRPQSVDSWDGGLTDELKKAAVGKKIGKILKFHIFASIGPTENGVGEVISFDWNHSYYVLCYISRLFWIFCSHFFTQPTDCRKTPCEKSAIRGINWLLP